MSNASTVQVNDKVSIYLASEDKWMGAGYVTALVPGGIVTSDDFFVTHGNYRLR